MTEEDLFFEEEDKHVCHVLAICTRETLDTYIEPFLHHSNTTIFSVTHLDSYHEVDHHKLSKLFEVVLLDLELEGESQPDALIHFSNQVDNVPIIGIVSEVNEREALTCMQQGAHDILAKEHISRYQLFKSIFFAIERHRVNEVFAQVKKLEYDSSRDPLTRLGNRRFLAEKLTHLIEYQRRNEKEFAVLFIDLDGFKPINDELGHKYGDGLLRAVASKLVRLVRATDYVCRWGGDEFVILLLDISSPDAAGKVASLVIESLRPPVEVLGQQLQVSASIGIAVFPEDSQVAEELLHKADMAMYKVKEGGKNAYEFFSPSMLSSIQFKQEMQHVLDCAIQEEGLSFQISPLRQIGGEAKTSLEVTLCWDSATKGNWSIEDLLALAKESRQINEMYRAALTHSLESLKASLENVPKVFFNLAGLHLQDESTVEYIVMSLASCMGPKISIHVALDGQVFSEPFETLEAFSHQLARRGVGLTLILGDQDTLKLAWLATLPLKGVIVGGRMSGRVRLTPTYKLLVRAIISLAHSLSLPAFVPESLSFEE